MVDDRELDRLLDDARRSWRVPPEPPLDAIWQNVEERLAPALWWRVPSWRMVAVAASIAVAVGLVGGRALARHTGGPDAMAQAPASAVQPAVASDPNHRAMGELLGRTAVLLAALPVDSARSIDASLTAESEKLLTETRLLLDSPVGADARLRSLLQDLELVLAQVARLEPARHRDDIDLIHAALDDRDIVPRLRSAVADYSLNDF